MSGKFTSFNIEHLDTGYWSKINEVLVNNEEMVKADQKILKTSNTEAKGEIYSTIEGKFYIQEENGINYYIYDLNNVGIEITVDEEESAKLIIGQKANLTFTGSSDVIEGRVYYIQKIPVDGNVKVKIKIDYTDKLKFGTNAKVEILLNEPIDNTVKEFDIKNTIPKIGKTKIIFNNQVDISSNIDDYLNQIGNEIDFDELNPSEIEEIEENEEGFETDELSEYYSNYWNEYWNNYWKSYYEEYQVIEVIEPEAME